MMYRLINALNPTQVLLLCVSLLLSLMLIILNNTGALTIALGDFIFYSGLLFLCALYRPGLMFLLFIGLLPLEIVNIAPHELPLALRPYQWIGVLTFVATMTRYAVGRLPYALPKMYKVEWLLVCLWIGSVVASFQGTNTPTGLKQSAVLASYIVLYAFARIFIRTLADIKNVLAFVMSTSVVVSMYAFWQNRRFLQHESSFQVMDGRPNSVFAEADWLGLYTVLIIGIAYALLFVLQKSKRGELDIVKLLNLSLPFRFSIRQAFKICVGLVLLFAIMTATLSVARSAWLSIGVMSAVLAVYVLYDSGSLPLWNSGRKQMLSFLVTITGIFVVGIALTQILPLTPFELWNRAQSTASGLQKITVACESPVALPESIPDISALEQYHCKHIALEDQESESLKGLSIQSIYRPDPNVNSRQEIYRKTWSALREHWLFGIGFGNSATILGQDSRGAGLNASNIFLEVWLGAGILGFLSFTILWISLGFTIWRRAWRMKLHTEWFAVFMGIGIVWMGMSVFNTFNSGLLLGFFWIWLAVAVHLSQRKIQPEEVVTTQKIY